MQGRKLTLREFAGEVGISVSLLSLIERGEHDPKPELIAEMAEKLGLDADGLCSLAGRLTPEDERLAARLARQDLTLYRQMMGDLRKRYPR